MEIGPIQGANLNPQTDLRASTPAGGFAELLGRAVGELQAISDNANAKVNALATGQDVELHDVMIALEAESLAISLATNVRNKAVEAYHEVFRMQI